MPKPRRRIYGAHKMLMQVNTIRDLMPRQPNWDAPLRMYYDETNNIRRLTLSEIGSNAPTDLTFAIAGIALQPGQVLAGWPELRHAMRIQPSAAEVKFKHVAASDYEAALASQKLSTALTWLMDAGALVHYSVLDVLFWSVVDIIDSMHHDERLPVFPFQQQLKNELHFAATHDTQALMALLHSFGYPNVQRAAVGEFLATILAFVEQRLPEDRNQHSRTLKQILRKAATLRGLELPLLHDSDPGELVPDFSIHFMHSVIVFKNASHIFDRETYVEEALRRIELRDGERQMDYRFTDSKDEIGIQLSDIVAGLIGRHFTYLRKHSLPELRQALAGFSERQRQNFGLLRQLIDRADAYSSGLVHGVLPLDTQLKNDAFLHGRRVPAYLG